jgi:DNA polymerase III delta subunit
MSLSNTAKEMLWIGSWNDLDEILSANNSLMLVAPDWSEISLDDAQGMIQDHAYESQKVQFDRNYYRGKPALRLTFFGRD